MQELSNKYIKGALILDSEFINVYVETAISTLEEYIKKDIMSRTNLEIANRLIKTLTEENNFLKIKLEESEEKIKKK
jgi:hypothetical protein